MHHSLPPAHSERRFEEECSTQVLWYYRSWQPLEAQRPWQPLEARSLLCHPASISVLLPNLLSAHPLHIPSICLHTPSSPLPFYLRRKRQTWTRILKCSQLQIGTATTACCMFLDAQAHRTRTVFTYLKAHLLQLIATKTVAARATSNCKSLQ